MQSKRMSLIEACVNTFGGYLIALAAQVVIFPFYGIEISLGTSAQIAVWFLLIALVRGYIFRRLFNLLDHRRAQAPPQHSS